jgi:hypothetical protein
MVEREAREILAQAYERANLTCPATDIRAGNKVDWVREAVALDAISAALHPTQPVGEPEGWREAHSDDLAVDRFAAKMKAKLAQARDKGRGGWDDPEQCGPTILLPMLHDHLAKGDPVDVANFAMMLDHYGASTAPFPTSNVQRARVKCDRLGCDWANGRAALASLPTNDATETLNG